MASYIDQSLGNGETVVARAHFPWFYGLSAWFSFLLPLAVLIAIYVEARGAGPVDSSNIYFWGLCIVGLWLLYGLFAGLKMLVVRATTELGVTSHRFVEKYGVFAMRTNEIALPNIEGVRVNQSFIGRIFGYGTVRIEGTGVDAVTTPPIADPVGFVRAIQTAKERA